MLPLNRPDDDPLATDRKPSGARRKPKKEGGIMEPIEEIIARLAQEQCWYLLANCERKANDSIREHGKEIGYCQTHAKEMRQRYADKR